MTFPSPIQIIEPHDYTGWITAIIEGRWVQAKVYNQGSTFGINNGRVSKLTISKTATRNPNANFFDQMAYNYDRGLDFHLKRELPQRLLDAILLQLESLPLLDLGEE